MPITQTAISNMRFAGAVPYIGQQDADGTQVVPSLQYVQAVSGLFLPVSSTNPVPVSDNGGALTVDGTVSLTGATPAGTAIIGKVGIDQTTPGTTNGVSVTGSNVTYTTPAHTVLGVTAASQTALAANANRKYAIFQNDSVNDIYLKLGGVAAVANQGILLNAAGGSYELKSSDGSLYTGAVTAIAAVAGPSNLLITEGV